MQLEWTGEHPRKYALAFAVQPRINEAGEAEVVVDRRDSQGGSRN